MATVDEIRALLKRGQVDKALAQSQALVRRKPKDPNALDVLSQSLARAGKFKPALTSYDRLIGLLPKHPKPLADKSLLLQQLGELEQADLVLRKAQQLEPLNGSLLRMRSAAKRLPQDDADLTRIQTAWENGTLPAKERMQAGFALAKTHGRDGFRYLDEANKIQRRAAPWDIKDRRAEVDALLKAMRGEWPMVEATQSSARPIFVTGMPRSGTTLVEQVLSCHPKVTAIGETGLGLRAAYSVLRKDADFRPVSKLTANDLALMGSRYLDGMQHFYTPGQIYTDKTITTYMVMGLLHHALPDARTIVVRRDPRDIGWSIYRNYFETGTHGYSNDQRDIARYVRTMEVFLDFWREVRPESFIEVRYEGLVTEPEPAIRRMLDYCGLDWDSACLAPERNARSVKTLSIEQVRSPISPKSIGGWRQYTQELAPMIDELGDLAAQWD